MSIQKITELGNDRIKEDIISTERVAWFSGATISLSFTLLGFLLSKEYFVSLKNSQPDTFYLLIFILIVSWIFLGISIILGLLVRLIGSSLNTARYLLLLAKQDNHPIKFLKKYEKKTNTLNNVFRKLVPAIHSLGMVGITLLLLFLILSTILLSLNIK